MKPPANADTDGRLPLTRRKLLSAGAGAATALVGLGAVTGSAAAWEELHAEFKGCSEVWITAGENDIACLTEDGEEFEGGNVECPLQVRVYTAEGGDIDSEDIDIHPDNATRIPGQFGDTPVFKYSVSGETKIIGIMGLTPPREPQCADLIANPNRCAQTPNTPSVYEADDVADLGCTPDEQTESGSEKESGPGRGSGPGRSSGPGRGKGP